MPRTAPGNVKSLRMNRAWITGSVWERAVLKWRSLFPSEKETHDVFSELRKAERILVLPSDRAGGLFFGVPVYMGLRRCFPDAEIALVCGEHMAGLARQISCVDEVITAELDSGPVWNSSQRRFTKSLRGRQFDLAICLGPDCSFRLCQVCARSGARLRVGFSRPDPGDWFNFEIVCEDRHAFEGRQYEVMLSLLGLESGGKGGWSIPQDRASEVRCRYLSGEFGAGDIVAIDLSRREGKGMSRRQIDDMVLGLIEGGSRAILFFSLAEGKLVDYLKSTYGNRILAFDLQDVSEAAPLLGGCRVLISCNTDILHLSIYLQVPAVAIFDEDSRRWISPGNDRVVVVQAKNVQAVSISEIREALGQARRLQPPPSTL